VAQASSVPFRGAPAHSGTLLRALSIAGVLCLAAEFVYQSVGTLATNSFIRGQSDVVVHTVNIWLFLRILFGPVLFALLTMCGVVAVQRTFKGRARRNLFAGIFVALLMLLLLIGPRLIHVSPGTTYVWGNATLHVLGNVLILLAAAVYLGATLLTQPRASRQ
jgi:hypothetical protein